MNETERIMKIEKKKYGNLIESAQNELDSAKSHKAPKGTITHFEQRITALKVHLKKIEAILSKDKVNAAVPSGKKGNKSKKGDE